MKLVDLSHFIATRFISRTDVIAIQKTDGSYAPRKQPFTRGLVEDHILGKRSLGHYLLNDDDRCRLMAFDLDFERGEYELQGGGFETITMSPTEALLGDDPHQRGIAIKYLRSMGESLGWMGEHMHTEIDRVLYGFSGNKGLHVYCLFKGLLSAQVAQALAQDTMMEFNRRFQRSGFTDRQFEPVRGVNFWAHPSYPGLTVECFPKQGKKSEYGNLMRLPYGNHAKSGQKGFLIDTSAPLHELKPLKEIA